MDQEIQTRRTPESRSLRVAAILLGVFSLAGIGFFGVYAIAGLLYQPTPDTQSQTAAATTTRTPDPFASVALIAKSAYVLDLKTGAVLYQENANVQLPLASLTKIALVLAVTQALSAGSTVSTPTKYSAPPSGGTSRLPAGKTWNLQDVIDFTLVASSDDGAMLLANAANDAIHEQYPDSPAQDATLWRMNDIAQQLGLTNTYFLDDTGLDESTTQSGAYGSARDIAKLFAYAVTTSPQTFSATAQPSVTVYATDGTASTGVNTDSALDAIPGIIMGKTGYTDLAGGNLAVVFDASPDHPVVAVVLGSTEDGRFSDMKQLVPAAQAAVAEGE
jgi:serine-type D-Ala-D-Ala carboxypeptidase (penicillin-binding protein 5/6)